MKIQWKYSYYWEQRISKIVSVQNLPICIYKQRGMVIHILLGWNNTQLRVFSISVIFRLVLGWVSNEMECNKINFTIYANSVLFRMSFFNFYFIPSISSAYTLILHVYPVRIRMDQMKWKCLCLARCSMTLVLLAGFKL